MSLHWQQWTDSMRAMKGLDDVLRYDLSPFCRKMEPAHEAYLRWACSALKVDAGLRLQSLWPGHVMPV